MGKAIAVLFLLVVAGIGYLVWKGAGVAAPGFAHGGDNGTSCDLGASEKARAAANKVTTEAKDLANQATALADTSVKSLTSEKEVIEITPGGKAEVKIARHGGDLKQLNLTVRLAADSKLTAAGGQFKDGDPQTTLTIQASPDIRADSAITISAGEKAKLILPVKIGGGATMAVKIRKLVAPPNDLSSFDPGEYLAGLEFYETDAPITEEDRNGLAQFAHLLAFFALKAKSNRWDGSIVPASSTAFHALECHFGQLKGWAEIVKDGKGIQYRQLVNFLMPYYPPQAPKK